MNVFSRKYYEIYSLCYPQSSENLLTFFDVRDLSLNSLSFRSHFHFSLFDFQAFSIFFLFSLLKYFCFFLFFHFEINFYPDFNLKFHFINLSTHFFLVLTKFQTIFVIFSSITLLDYFKNNSQFQTG